MQAPILIVPYMWIGDFVRCHTVVKLLREREPSRAIDMLATSNVAPLVDYMPGVRKGIIVDLPRKQLAYAEHRALADRLRAEGYCHALVMPRTWKAALAPYLAGIHRRTGFFGEAIHVDSTNALHAAVGRVTSWCGPTENYFVTLLRAREQFGALLHALNRRQRRPALPAASENY